MQVLGRTDTSLCCNDRHSHLNTTQMRGAFSPATTADVVSTMKWLHERGECMAVKGSGHAMGGQQFAADAWLMETSKLNKVLWFDRQRGLIRVQPGIEWPALMRHYLVEQRDGQSAWGIRQKQTGADRLSIGGAVAANIHGRGLTYAPFVSDIESLEVVFPDGSVRECNRLVNTELFRTVVGGYGLFGVVTAVTLRLVPRVQVRRVVELRTVDDVASGFDERIAQGYTYGDFQFSTAHDDPGFMRQGVFSCYQPLDEVVAIPERQLRLSPSDWRRLLLLAHVDKKQAFKDFSEFYLRSSGQIYWSDTHQLSIYLDDYHRELDASLHAGVPGSEVITELYVPKPHLVSFMNAVRADFLRHQVDFIYGTIRLIARDTETMLAWAKQDYACVIFNLHVNHDPDGQCAAAESFRRLIDLAIAHDGSYFLTYHRHAARAQVSRCYPQFGRFLEAKRRIDPLELLQSDWYRHYRDEFGEAV